MIKKFSKIKMSVNSKCCDSSECNSLDINRELYRLSETSQSVFYTLITTGILCSLPVLIMPFPTTTSSSTNTATCSPCK